MPDSTAEQHERIWDAWNSFHGTYNAPIKRIANSLNLTTAEVAAVVYPTDAFGEWNDNQEPDINDLVPAEAAEAEVLMEGAATPNGGEQGVGRQGSGTPVVGTRPRSLISNFSFLLRRIRVLRS